MRGRHHPAGFRRGSRVPGVIRYSPRSIGLNLVKNALAPVVVKLRPGRGTLGMDGNVGAIADTLEWLALPIEKLDVSFAGAQVLEVGPGRTPQVCGAAVLAGATSATGIDVVRYLDRESDRAERLAPLLDILASGRADTWCRATATEIGRARRHAASFGARWPVRFPTFDGQVLPLADTSVDVVMSKSALEHVPWRLVEPQLADLYRVLRPGGVMVHIIDLRDHFHMKGDDDVTGDWLEALRYPQRLYDAMFSNRSTNINRLRASEWLDVFTAAGFETEYEERKVFPLPDDFDPSQLQERWQGFARSELDVGYLTVGLRKP
jgi:ubiquinone/menaquinone biosynthesis C-methylase UbiE